MEALSAMLADAADSLNGKLYIHGGGWDTLVIRQFPAAHPSLALALVLSADASEAPGTGELRVQLVDEDGNDVGVGAVASLAIGHSPMYRPGQRSLIPIAITFPGVRFDKPGLYEFQLFWNGEPLGSSVSFRVTTPPQMPGMTPAAGPETAAPTG
jgi:hypothetical protein